MSTTRLPPPGVRHPGGVARAPATPGGTDRRRWLVAFAAVSTAQGAPFTVAAVRLGRAGGAGTWLLALAAARLVPCLLGAPLAGAVASRHRVASVFAVACAGRAGAAIGAAWAFHEGAPPLVPVALLAVGVAAGTPCYPAVVRHLHAASPADAVVRSRVVATAAAVEAAAFCAGPAVGGLLLVADPGGGVALVATLTLLALPVATTRHRGGARPSGEVPGRGGIAAVLRSVRWLAAPAVRRTAAAALGADALAGAHAVLLVRLATAPGGGARWYGWLTAVDGLAAVVALVAVRRRRPDVGSTARA